MNIFKVLQLIIVVLLILLIMIQSKGKGLTSGVGSAFSAYRSRRGAEKVIFYLTILMVICLVVNSLAIVLFS